MSKQVLTIDDSKTVRMMIARYLEQFDVEVIQAENGFVGMHKASAHEPDLILLDYNMPMRNGYETLERLKSDPRLQNIPVMMLTTEADRDTVVSLIQLGLRDYLTKPFTREVFLAKVNQVLSLFDGEVPAEAPEEKPEPEAPHQGPQWDIFVEAQKAERLNAELASEIPHEEPTAEILPEESKSQPGDPGTR